MEYLSLGKIIDSFGLDGTLKVYSTTDNQKLRYKKGNKLFLYNEQNDERIPVTVVSYRSSGNLDYVKFEEITNPEKGKEYKGFEIHTIKDRNELQVGYYFYSDLLDCLVVDQNKNVVAVPVENTVATLNNLNTFKGVGDYAGRNPYSSNGEYKIRNSNNTAIDCYFIKSVSEYTDQLDRISEVAETFATGFDADAQFVILSEAEYNNLQSKANNTIYFIY